MTLMAAPIGPQAYSRQYAAIGQAARQAREDVEVILLTWHMEALVYAAKQIISEMVANTVDQFDIPKVEMQLTRTLLGVRLALTDSSSALPVKKPTTPTDESGRGLLLMDAFCAEWGCDPLPVGKRVWADLHL